MNKYLNVKLFSCEFWNPFNARLLLVLYYSRDCLQCRLIIEGHKLHSLKARTSPSNVPSDPPYFRLLSQNMASWKCALYGVVATLIIVLIILLNFDFLPKRKLSEELELAKKSGHKRPITPTGITTLRTSTSTVEKDENVKVSVTQYLKDIMNWSCTKDYSHMDHLPELTFEDVKNVT